MRGSRISYDQPLRESEVKRYFVNAEGDDDVLPGIIGRAIGLIKEERKGTLHPRSIPSCGLVGNGGQGFLSGRIKRKQEKNSKFPRDDDTVVHFLLKKSCFSLTTSEVHFAHCTHSGRGEEGVSKRPPFSTVVLPVCTNVVSPPTLLDTREMILGDYFFFFFQQLIISNRGGGDREFLFSSLSAHFCCLQVWT